MNCKVMIQFVLLATAVASAQTPAKPAPETLTGCVARIPTTADKYVIATGNRCMLLTGSYDPTKIADHEVTATGTEVEPSGTLPLTLNVQSIKSVKAACTKTCVLEPPGTRGIHGKERPGAEGGTPGVTKTPGAQPQQ